MARSFYKGERLGSTPACAICVGPGRGRRAELHLPCGVRVWLCDAHRSIEFQTRRAGRDLVTSLMHVWRSSGCFTRRRSRALDLHHARLLQGDAGQPLPGSYSWPKLRVQAEAAFAAGERPDAVIARIRGRARCGDGVLPSVRTMRRWFRDGRWLTRAPSADAVPAAPGRPPTSVPAVAPPTPGGDTTEPRAHRSGGGGGGRAAADSS